MIKRDIHRRLIYESRCDERIKDKDARSTRLTYTGLFGGLEHLKIETRLIDDIGELSILRLIRSVTTLVRMLTTFDLRCEENATR